MSPLPSLNSLRLNPLRAAWPHVAHFERVLGTSLEVRIAAARPERARAAQDVLLGEIDRLEAIFSRFDPASELNRWQTAAGEVPVSEDLAWLLRAGLRWQALTHGAFHPGADALDQLWRAAAIAGTPPTDDDLARTVALLRAPAYHVAWGAALAGRPTLPLNFNAIAKGRVVDLACGAARATEGVRAVLVNVGGDLRHLGGAGVCVAIADPFTDADNAPPLTRVRVAGQGVASSGRARRGYQIGGRRHSHVLDPRTGEPARRVVGASVIAPDCATADVLATAMSVLHPEESLALADALPGVGCLLVTREAGLFSNAYWRRHELPPGRRPP